MTKYIVKDWAGNVMNWGEFEHEDGAMEAIDEHVREELLLAGIDLTKVYRLSDEYPCLDLAIDKIVTEYTGEYYIDELEEG